MKNDRMFHVKHLIAKVLNLIIIVTVSEIYKSHSEI